MKKLIRVAKVTIIVLICLTVVLSLITVLFMQQDKFGENPSGSHLERIASTKHFKDGQFQNLIFTPDITEGYSTWSILYDQFFVNHPRLKPDSPVPSVKTDLKKLDSEQDVLVWFGHSSYYLQLGGIKILVDPVFSGSASPVPGTVKAFPGTDQYTVEDLPPIDLLIISHDHYDHLDHKTIVKLKDKITTVVAGLGIGSHFKKWGYAPDQIREQDWNQSLEFDSNLTVHTLPARHFSGRGFSRKKTLWASYMLETPDRKIYVGGDSGYGPHFADIGQRFGSIDLALLDNGQYNDAWKEIHLHPEEVIQAAKDLKANRLFPVHSAKFVLAMHPWDEPLTRVSTLAEQDSVSLVTPIIGELIDLDKMDREFPKWWEGVD